MAVQWLQVFSTTTSSICPFSNSWQNISEQVHEAKKMLSVECTSFFLRRPQATEAYLIDSKITRVRLMATAKTIHYSADSRNSRWSCQESEIGMLIMRSKFPLKCLGMFMFRVTSKSCLLASSLQVGHECTSSKMLCSH